MKQSQLPEAAGAQVIISETRGKGISMKDGIRVAKNEVIVFLDADINPYPEGTLEKLYTPLLNNEVDFVKGAFARNAGRVTELVAKPFCIYYFPASLIFLNP